MTNPDELIKKIQSTSSEARKRQQEAVKNIKAENITWIKLEPSRKV